MTAAASFRSTAHVVALACAGLAVGCNSTVQLNLVVYDPCNQKALSQAKQIEVDIDAPSLSQPQGTIWNAADGQGELRDLPVVKDATVSVLGLAQGSSGGAGSPVVATSVGKVDLSGANGTNLVNLSVVVGKVDTFINTTYTDNAQQCSALAAERRDHTATLLDDGRVFIAGGTSTDVSGNTTYWATTELYNPETGVFTRGPDMKWKRQGHTATLLRDGRVLLIGGYGLISDSAQALLVGRIYDPASNTFTDVVQFAQQRAYHTATLLEDGTVLIAGGEFGGGDPNSGTQGGSELTSTEIYDPSASLPSQRVRPGPTLNVPRAFHSAVRIGPYTVALIGGRGSGSVLSSVEFVSTKPAKSVMGPSLNQGRSHAVAALIPGKDAIMVAGGFGNTVDAPEHGQGIDSMEIIELDTTNLANSTVACSNLKLNAKRGDAAIATLPNGVLIAGGVDGSGNVLASAETVQFGDLASCTVTIQPTAGDMGTPRAGEQLTPLVGGDVLVTGGFTTSGSDVVSVAQSEIFIRPR